MFKYKNDESSGVVWQCRVNSHLYMLMWKAKGSLNFNKLEKVEKKKTYSVVVLLLFLDELLEYSKIFYFELMNRIFRTWLWKSLLYSEEREQLLSYPVFLDTYTPDSGVRPSYYFIKVKNKLLMLTTFSPSPHQLLLYCPGAGKLSSLLRSLSYHGK